MTNPTDFSQLLPYILNLLAPYLLSGPMLSHALEQLPFFDDPDDKWPDWLQIGVIYVICLGLVIANGILTGVYANGLTGVLIRDTLANATAFISMVTLPHLAINQFLPSLAKWLGVLLGQVGVFISGIFHPVQPPTTPEVLAAG